jgi:hypothetical protein
MENKQTAVNLLEDLIHFECQYTNDNKILIDHYILDNIIEQAKQMEKEQIKDAFTDGCIGELYELNAYYTSEKYYNNTYGPQVDKE